MKAVIGANDPEKPKPSSISNGAIYIRHNESAPYLIYENPARDGSIFLYLDGYMICPMDLFSRRQIKAALKKYRSVNSPAG